MVSLMELHDRQRETMCDLILAIGQRIIIPEGHDRPLTERWGGNDMLIVVFDKFELYYPGHLKADLTKLCQGFNVDDVPKAQAIGFPIATRWQGVCRKQIVSAKTNRSIRQQCLDLMYAR